MNYYLFYYIFPLTFALRDITKHPSWMLIDHDRCGLSQADRIIGGKNASLGMYPWIIRIGYLTSISDEQIFINGTINPKITFRCGGSLINKFYVISAAHCVVNLPKSYRAVMVRIGEHNTETNPDCENEYCSEPIQDIEPIQIVVHKDYNKPPFKHDISIIRLKRPVVFHDFVMPICLPYGDLLTKDFVGEKAETAGWGLYDLNTPKASTILQTLKLPVLELETCVKSFKRMTKIGDGQLCVGGKVGEDSCTGDSGGPLMKVESFNGPPKYYFMGIVSFGAKRCAETNLPAVYTKIASYIEWILENISV